ncbi:uncharacterized protein [Tenebrio molitor]|uniref:uncharacterized protein n=1 Tax=Tenebrio molitor TaxID=7067 RepID=UPI001C397487|nr:unnamed protein product [Tenebrio molitor]
MTILARMLLFGFDLLFQPVHILAHSSHKSQPRVCLVRNEPQDDPYSATNYTYTTVYCYNSYCCKNGCCDWYINVSIVIFVILVFIFFWICIEACWHKFCKSVPRSIDNDSREALVLMSFSQNDDGAGSSGHPHGYKSTSYFSPIPSKI